MENRAARRHPDRSWRKPDLREGYTTSACAAASAAAATRALLTGVAVSEIVIDLPAKKQVLFKIVRCELAPGQALCGTIKDAGDDPDVTNGAEICAVVTRQEVPGVSIEGGLGVGVVTLPGLPVSVGSPAINPGARRIITRAVEAEIGEKVPETGLRITLTVPEGERIALETLNPRLGIVGGISILGTTGVVKPFSQSAYRASIYTELRVAAHNAIRRAILSTGSRSEEYACLRYPDQSALGCVQVGDHVDHALKQARRLGFSRVVISTMVGKASKLAQGRLQTHVSEGMVDFVFLAELARELGADEALTARIRSANTARHVQMLLRQASLLGLETRLAQLAVEKVDAFVDGAFDVEVLVYDIDGELLGAATMERKA